MRPVTEITAFQTSDGQTFERESDAKNHQYDLDIAAFCGEHYVEVNNSADLITLLQLLQNAGFITLRRGV